MIEQVTGHAGKPPSASRLALSQIMTQNDSNLLGTVHGGVLTRLADSIAGVVTARHCEGPTVTASIDEVVFLVPVHIGDVLHLHAQVNWAGSTSMEAGVRITAERWDRSDPPVHVASAYVVLVGIDGESRPRRVPPLVPETAEDRRRFTEAGIRRTHRLARRAAILESRRAQQE